MHKVQGSPPPIIGQKRSDEFNGDSECKFGGRKTAKVKGGFTYYPESKSEIKAVKITYRQLYEVLTIYREDNAICFRHKQCQESIGYKSNDIIDGKDTTHSADLHKSENPSDYHSHIILSQENHRDQIKNLFSRHIQEDVAEKHTEQFYTSMEAFRFHDISGIRFPDKSTSHNSECKDLNESSPIDFNGFIQSKNLESVDENA